MAVVVVHKLEIYVQRDTFWQNPCRVVRLVYTKYCPALTSLGMHLFSRVKSTVLFYDGLCPTFLFGLASV